jgi:hypothetical protein
VLEAADKIGATDMKKHALMLIAQDFPKVRIYPAIFNYWIYHRFQFSHAVLKPEYS